MSSIVPYINHTKDDSSNFKDVFNKYIYHWPLFLAGLIICIGCAYLYVNRIGTVYDVQATVLIKDKNKSPDEKSMLQELEITSTPKLAESEIEVFKSRNLIDHVVSDLQLWVTYQLNNGLKKAEFYKDSPVAFRLLDSSGYIGEQSFKIKIKDKNSFSLERSDGTSNVFYFKDKLVNGFGIWKLDVNSNYQQFIGREITIFIKDPGDVAESYQKSIDAAMINKLAPVIGLTVKDKIEQRGKDIINDLIRNYNQNDIGEKNKITQSTLDFIDKRIGSIADELNNSEKDLETYRSSKGVTNISFQSQAYLDNIKTNDNKLNDVKVQLMVIDGIESKLNSTADIQSSPASLGPNYPALNNLIQKLSDLQSKKNNLLATVPESNPIYDPINREIKATKANIKDNIESIKSGLIDAQNKLEAIGSTFESTIRNIPGQERGLVDKTRQQSVKENLYTYLLQKREEISMSYASTLSDARIVDYAYSTVDSKKTMIYGVALMFGLLLPAGLIYTRNNFTNRVVAGKEIEKTIGGPLFGELAYAKSSSGVIVNDKANFAVGEEFRAIRTNLHFFKGDKSNGLVILLTSSISNEGKSFVSSNLGTVLAASGKKTIILEMDLRKPKVGEIFNLESNPGIFDFLTGQSPKEAIIKNSKIHSELDIICSGQLPKEPSEMLGHEQIDSLINWLKSTYDYILIDSPPINLVTDAKILSRVADMTLYIVRQAHTYKSLLPFIKSLVSEQKFPNMKFVFNGIKKAKYGYDTNYGNEYYQSINRGSKVFKAFGLNDFFKRF